MTSCVISQKRAKENRITVELHLLIPEGHAHISKEESLDCLRSLEISQYIPLHYCVTEKCAELFTEMTRDIGTRRRCGMSNDQGSNRRLLNFSVTEGGPRADIYQTGTNWEG